MLNIIKVEMPKDRVYIIKRNKSQTPYVYYVLKTYRNKKGQPTNDNILIGKKDEETGMLIPNDNYFTVFDCEIIINVKGVKKHE